MTDTTYRATLADAERAFKLTGAAIADLEKATGHGLGRLSRKVFEGEFTFAEVMAVIRHGLIGAGESQARVDDLMMHAAGRPVAETLPIAIGILDCLWNGNVSNAFETNDALD